MAGKGKNEPVIRYEDLPENLQKKVRQQLEREKRSSLGYRLGQLLRGGGKERPESGKAAAPAAASPAAEKPAAGGERAPEVPPVLREALEDVYARAARNMEGMKGFSGIPFTIAHLTKPGEMIRAWTADTDTLKRETYGSGGFFHIPPRARRARVDLRLSIEFYRRNAEAGKKAQILDLLQAMDERIENLTQLDFGDALENFVR